MSFIRDTMLVFRRQERLALRQPAWVIIGLTQPILYLALFGPLLKGLPGAGHYFNTIMIEGIAVAAGMALLFLWLGSRVFVQENA
jgi:ABC-2 type transport system permease protein